MPLIRQATSADSEQVFSLAREFATSFAPEPAAFQVAFDHLIVQDDALLLVAEGSGTVCGYLLAFDHYTFFANGRVAWVEEIMVREDHRREGIDGQLMGRFEEWARSHRAKFAALATRRADQFYQALGYEESASYFRKLLSDDV
ncbi:MAG: GCN5-related N-acetyltransferase [Phycisphaerales bacterium]|nr:GCN5-related N-acetyltransferase [Phycisphaerales bacterium]